MSNPYIAKFVNSVMVHFNSALYDLTLDQLREVFFEVEVTKPLSICIDIKPYRLIKNAPSFISHVFEGNLNEYESFLKTSETKNKIEYIYNSINNSIIKARKVTKIEIIEIDDFAIKGLIKALEQNKYFTKLKIDGSNISFESYKNLYNFTYSKNGQLKEISLKLLSNINDDREIQKNIINIIHSNASLENLSLIFKSPPELKFAKKIARAITQNNSIKHYTLNNFFDTITIDNNKILKILNSSIYKGEISEISICEDLNEKNEKQLQYLSNIIKHTKRIELSPDSDDNVTEAVLHAIGESKTIVELIRPKDHDISDVTLFAEAFERNDSIKILKLKGFAYVEEGVEELVETIKDNTNLFFDILDLSELGTEGENFSTTSPKILELINKSSNVKLNGLSYDSSEVDIIIEQILISPKLLTLNLFNSSLTNEDDLKIAKAIEENCTLIEINTSSEDDPCKETDESLIRITQRNKKNLYAILNTLIEIVSESKPLSSFPLKMVQALEKRYEAIKYLFEKELENNPILKAAVDSLYIDTNDPVYSFERLFTDIRREVENCWIRKSRIYNKDERIEGNLLLGLSKELQYKIGKMVNNEIDLTNKTNETNNNSGWADKIITYAKDDKKRSWDRM
ncbi:MAG: hypothetical protein ACK4OM_06980 [Alphaproteobacteria bacterium]